MNWAKPALWMVLGGLALAATIWAFRPQPVPVEIAVVTQGAFVETVDDDGVTRVRERYVVSAPLGGQLLRVGVKAGDTVERDGGVAVIVPSAAAMLDPRTRAELSERVGAAEARVQRAGAEIARSRAALAQARVDLERADKLAKSGFVSASARDQAELALQIRQREAESAVFEKHAAEHDLAQARAALARSRSFADGHSPGTEWELRSPVAGRVLKVLKESETVVAAGTPILEIANPRDLEVLVDVLSNEAVEIVPGAAVMLDAGGGLLLEGRVRLVEPSAFTKISALGVEEQRVNVTIDITSPPEQWQALGDAYRVDARIVVHRREQAVKVPVAALFRDGESWAVFLDAEGRAQKRRVEISRRGGLEAVVEKGLAPGDRVIVYPGDAVEDGARVEPSTGRGA
jgi:HlyD family secretion protein